MRADRRQQPHQDMTDNPSNNALTGRTLNRADLAHAVAFRSSAIVINGCTLDGEDLSRLDLRGVRFEHCTFMDASFELADLSETTWQSCRAGRARFAMADLTEARFEGCDLNNTTWVPSDEACTVSMQRPALPQSRKS